MQPTQIAGLVVLSATVLLIFWKLIQRDFIEKSLLTLLAMIGFFAGLPFSILIVVFLYAKSPKGYISRVEWMNCICVIGVITIFGFVISSLFIPIKLVTGTFGIVFSVGYFVSFMTWMISSEQKIWINDMPDK